MQDFRHGTDALDFLTTPASSVADWKSTSGVDMRTRASSKATEGQPQGLQLGSEIPEGHLNPAPPDIAHDEAQTRSPQSRSPITLQVDQAAEPEGCARARAWTYDNALLRQLPWLHDEDPDLTPPDDAAAESYMADVDITTPEIADIASTIDMRSTAAQAHYLNQQCMDLGPQTSGCCATDAHPAQLDAAQQLQVQQRSAGVDSFRLANHDANCIVQQINQLWERRDAHQTQANALHDRIRLLETELIAAKQQAATADAKVQIADSEHQDLSQQLEYMLETVSTMLTTMQGVKRRRL